MSSAPASSRCSSGGIGYSGHLSHRSVWQPQRGIAWSCLHMTSGSARDGLECQSGLPQPDCAAACAPTRPRRSPCCTLCWRAICARLPLSDAWSEWMQMQSVQPHMIMLFALNRRTLHSAEMM
eukprot:6242487-Prymnesium_polylepis.1